MCITIIQDAAESARSKMNDNQSGFTIPEVLVSLFILLMIVQLICQWGPLTSGTTSRINENDQAIYLAQQTFAGLEPQCSDGWQITTEQTNRSALLHETVVTVSKGQHSWEFYYAGPK